MAWITVDDSGENAIVVIPGANDHAVPQVDDLQPGDVLLCQLELPIAQVEHAVRRAAALGARVVLNAAPFTVLARDVVALADPMVVNEHEAAALADSGLVPRSLLVTFGAAGAQWDDVRVEADAGAGARGRRHHRSRRRVLRRVGRQPWPAGRPAYRARRRDPGRLPRRCAESGPSPIRGSDSMHAASHLGRDLRREACTP